MDAFTTCLWFDTNGEEAARFYTGIFPNSSIGKVTPYPAGERAGQTMTVDFVLNGSKFVALNGPGVHLQRVDLLPGRVRRPG